MSLDETQGHSKTDVHKEEKKKNSCENIQDLPAFC